MGYLISLNFGFLLQYNVNFLTLRLKGVTNKIQNTKYFTYHRKFQYLLKLCFILFLPFFRFGWDVPVILRNSEETQFNTRVFKKQMRQVKNPFGLEITNPSSASITSWWLFSKDFSLFLWPFLSPLIFFLYCFLFLRPSKHLLSTCSVLGAMLHTWDTTTSNSQILLVRSLSTSK